MMSGAKKMVPKRRFKEFLNAGDWEQRKLGDFTNQINTFVNPEDAKLPLWSLTAEAGLIEKSDRYERDFLVKKKDQFKRIETNTLVYNPMNITIGSIDIYTGLYPIAVSGYYVSIVYDKNIDTDFLKEVLLLPSSLKMYKNYATGSLIERQRVQYPTFSKLQLLLPNLDEQKAIGQFFKSLNLDITLHQRKLDKLQATKKALLQEMFPEEGQNKPKRRFKGFTDAWEQRKLGEIFEYLQNNTLSRDSLNYKNPNIKNIHYGDILVKFDEILDGSNKDIPYINSELDLSKFSKSLLRDGDIVFSDTAEDDTVGKAIELQNVNAPFILGGLHTIPCRPLIPFGKGYLGNFLNSDSYRLQLRPLIQGIKVSSISKSALKDTMIEYPKNLDEQEKIGSLFYYIAKMITLHQQKPFLCGNSVNGGVELC